MADKHLCGNGEPCPGCELRRGEPEISPDPLTIACNYCGGDGRLALPAARIVANQVAEARKHHWGGAPHLPPIPKQGE